MIPDSIDWSSLATSPLVIGIPLIIGVAVAIWIVTEAAGFIPAVTPKWRPVVAIALGPFMGWALDATNRLNFGAGPEGRGTALLYGLLAGAVAVLGHDRFKAVPPLSWLAARTPSTGGGE